MKMEFFLLLTVLTFASEQTENEAESVAKSPKKIEENSADNPIFVKIEEDEYAKVNKKPSSDYIGVTYHQEKPHRVPKWRVRRWSKSESKKVYNGYYGDEETAAHASDTLARKLMANGEHGHKLNFPDDDIEVHKTPFTSFYFGVSYHKDNSKWYVQRRSKNDKKMISNGCYGDEEKAAHASDTLARILIANGEHHKLNFPDDDTEVYPEKQISSKYLGVSYDKKIQRWAVVRWSKTENKSVYHGLYKDEEKAAHESDILARKLMANGEQNHRLNFPDSKESKRKRSNNEDLE